MGKVRAPFVAGFYNDPDEFLAAAQASTAKGHKHADAFCPYVIHGMEHALGIKRSWIGRVVLPVLLLGAFGGFMMQLWMMKWDWPIIIGGKPYNSWPAFVVITFEAGILSAAVTNFLVLLFVACRIYPRSPVHVLKDELTDDVFALCIPVKGNGTVDELSSFLDEHGADDVAVYEAPRDSATSDTAATPDDGEGGAHA